MRVKSTKKSRKTLSMRLSNQRYRHRVAAVCRVNEELIHTSRKVCEDEVFGGGQED